MAHRKRYGRNEFLVHYKGFSEFRGEFTEEAELRRNASELLDEYMKRYNIKTDGFKFDDVKYDDSLSRCVGAVSERVRACRQCSCVSTLLSTEFCVNKQNVLVTGAADSLTVKVVGCSE